MADTDKTEAIDEMEAAPAVDAAEAEEKSEPALEAAAPEAPETPEPPEEPKLRGQTSWPTRLLVVFNLLATLGFGFVLFTDIGKRQDWARAVLFRDLAVVGLPVNDQDSKSGNNAEAGKLPIHDLDPPLLKDAYKARGGKLSDKFMAVHENFKARPRVADLNPTLLAKYFSDAGAGSPVLSLQEEVRHLKEQLPGKLDTVAREFAAKNKGKSVQEKQVLLERLLFPLCTEGWQVVKVDEKIRAERDAKRDEEFLIAAAKRRLWFDILQPLQVFRPGENLNAWKLDDVKVDKLQDLFAKRCDGVLADKDWTDNKISRDNPEKRRCVAFLLLDVSRVEAPGSEPAELKQDNEAAPEAKGDKKDQPAAPKANAQKQVAQPSFAFPNQERRVAVVCGLRDFDQACEDLTVVDEILEKQRVQAIVRDLGNFHYPLGYPAKFAGELVKAMKTMKIDISDEAAFQRAVEDKIKGLRGKLDDTTVLLAELKKVMDAQQIQVPPSSQSTFEGQVNTLLNSNALGFLGQYDMAIQNLQELATIVEHRKAQYEELKKNFDQRAALMEKRVDHEAKTIEKVLEARQATRRLAAELKVLQDELFVAQVNLAGAHAYNLYLANRVAETEKMKSKVKQGPRQ